ncbi:hypothetical protein [Azomonas macrocytogenes]|uniref:Uncharacterized protein n=1 Tax=Azomonas macrocytogenes TaxID=69962 RepID=A0A839T5M3_AZOMA|nr:hypothetical protein [Azomonas macrocytogenes]MBB3103786.1 hypothetical protein [Azomonas macrocytogenes]
MRTTIKYKQGNDAKSIEVDDEHLTELKAKQFLVETLKPLPVDFGREGRPSLKEQFDAQLRNIGITDIQVITG